MKYKVVRNDRCTCHPETCCCDEYAVVDLTGKKITTVFDEVTGAQLIYLLNLNESF